MALRLALVAMAADTTSSLTAEQRAWVIMRGQQSLHFTASEGATLKTPLLTWLKVRMPRAFDVVEQHLEELAL